MNSSVQIPHPIENDIHIVGALVLAREVRAVVGVIAGRGEGDLGGAQMI